MMPFAFQPPLVLPRAGTAPKCQRSVPHAVFSAPPQRWTALGSAIDAVALVGKRSARSRAQRLPSRVLAGFGRVVVAARGRHRRRRHGHADHASKGCGDQHDLQTLRPLPLSTLTLAARLALRTTSARLTWARSCFRFVQPKRASADARRHPRSSSNAAAGASPPRRLRSGERSSAANDGGTHRPGCRVHGDRCRLRSAPAAAV